jgi:hypothetical protein
VTQGDALGWDYGAPLALGALTRTEQMKDRWNSRFPSGMTERKARTKTKAKAEVEVV